MSEEQEPIYIGSDDSVPIIAAVPAAMNARKFMTSIAGDRGGFMHTPDVPVEFTGLLGRWKAELNRRLTDGRTGFCDHLALQSAQVMIWFVYAGDLLRCASCAAEAARAVMGTPEDDLCDSCGVLVVGPHMHTISGELTAQIRKGVVCGPILIHGGVCATCAEIDLAEIAKVMGPGRRIEPGAK